MIQDERLLEAEQAQGSASAGNAMLALPSVAGEGEGAVVEAVVGEGGTGGTALVAATQAVEVRWEGRYT